MIFIGIIFTVATANAASNPDGGWNCHFRESVQILQPKLDPNTGEISDKPVGQLDAGTNVKCYREADSSGNILIDYHGKKTPVRSTFVDEGITVDITKKGVTSPASENAETIETRHPVAKTSQVFLDTIQHQVQIFNKPGENYSNVDPKSDRPQVRLDTDGDAEIDGEKVALFAEQESVVANYKDPITKQVGPKVFSYVVAVPLDRVDDYKKGKYTATVKGWMNSDSLTDEHLTRADVKASCPDAILPPQTTDGQLKNLKDRIDKGTKAAEDHLIAGTNTCPASFKDVVAATPQRADGKEVAAPVRSPPHQSFFYPFISKLRDHFQTNPPQTKFSQPEVISAIALAHSIVGEVGNCVYSLGPEYAMAVARIAYNRARVCQVNPKCEFVDHGIANGEDFNSPHVGLPNALVEALGKPAQFQTWEGPNHNSENTVCIENNAPNREAFDAAYRVAIQAAVGSPEFLKKTDALKNVLNYAKGDAKPCSTAVRLPQPHIADLRIKSSCFVPYICR